MKSVTMFMLDVTGNKKMVQSGYRRLLIFIALAAGFSSCTSTLYIAPKKVECTGGSDQMCYLVRYSPTGNWIMHYRDIQGLDYEPGFSYKIKVKKEKLKNPGMEGSAIKYNLVEVLEKRDVTDDIAMEDLAGKEWKLEYLKSDNIQYGIEHKVPTLKFSTEGSVSGNGGCNNFSGTFMLNGRTITIGPLGATRMACDETMELENAYFSVLALELRALFSDGKLVLSGDEGNRLIFGYK